ncbi:uroporphyrinogen decarboxylase [Arboricoccus pini]|uniref:Uroporphyrinogen decarboxylase n=1 Tax=Arboricoccus pini TaxID=1963835 RepID=A0A212R9D3_9PROT|nr:uroporphyrinogen decarboxylase [Arboricoccus pini]SNB68811.1 uroporphyrinogen decarboxylase [Arboricoccus pini]
MSEGQEGRKGPPKRLLAKLKGTAAGRPPIWLMRQAGRYLPEYREVRASAGSFLDLCYTPSLAVEVTLQPIRRFGLDAAILFSDILVVPDAMGMDVRFVEGEGPRLEPLKGPADVERLDGSGLRRHLQPVYETVRGIARALPPDVALIGFSGAPWTLAAYMIEGRGSREFAALTHFATTHPEAFALLLDKLVLAIVEHLDAQIRAGAEAVQLFDSWAGLIPAARLDEWCLTPAARIQEALRQRHPDIPLLFFPRGIERPADLARVALGSGAAGISLGTGVSMRWAADLFGPATRCIQGNLDPELLLGPEARMLQAAGDILKATAGRPHIFNLGHGVIKDTAPETVATLVSYLQSQPD